MSMVKDQEVALDEMEKTSQDIFGSTLYEMEIER